MRGKYSTPMQEDLTRIEETANRANRETFELRRRVMDLEDRKGFVDPNELADIHAKFKTLFEVSMDMNEVDRLNSDAINDLNARIRLTNARLTNSWWIFLTCSFIGAIMGRLFIGIWGW
jgi:hypothetical protein